MKVLIIDNYDSFTFNIYHYCKAFCNDVQVYRNDEISLDDIHHYSHIIISPGPGLPRNAGITIDVLNAYGNSKPILGICLGLQAIVEFFGGKLYNQNIVKHGLQEEIFLNVTNSGLFNKLPQLTQVGLYHSWAADYQLLPECLKVTAVSKLGVVMGIQHIHLPIYGVQFHPESIMTPLGKKMIENWLKESILKAVK